MVKARKYTLQRHSEGFPVPSDFRLEEEELPPLEEGEFLAEAVFLSVDPYMRPFISSLPLGATMIGSQVAKIIESRSSKYPVGKYLEAYFGWRTHTIAHESTPMGKGGEFIAEAVFTSVDPYMRSRVSESSPGSGVASLILPDFGNLSLSLALGVLGMPGNSAYFGFLEICQPKAGETVVVSGAAGAVGNHVGQIARIKGCKVIGIAGSDEKGEWLTQELGFDHFINYKTQNVEEELKKAAPNGVDCYFDNVGGEISTIVLNQMNTYGRTSVCGGISGYNEKRPPKVTSPQWAIVGKQLKIEGFIVGRWLDRWSEGVEQNKRWLEEGKLKYKETVTEGFENMPNAFIDMLLGGNVGKAVVKV